MHGLGQIVQADPGMRQHGFDALSSGVIAQARVQVAEGKQVHACAFADFRQDAERPHRHAARAVFAVALGVTKAVAGGRASVVSGESLSMVTRDNPFTSERARRELGWSPQVRPERGIPEAFRWWVEHH